MVTEICVRIKVEGDLALVVWTHISGELSSLFAEANLWMMMMKHVLESLHGCTNQRSICSMVHMEIESILCIIDVELSIDRSLAFPWNERSSFVTETTLNLKHIGTTSMFVNLLVLIASQRCHCQFIVIVLNMIMKFLRLIILT